MIHVNFFPGHSLQLHGWRKVCSHGGNSDDQGTPSPEDKNRDCICRCH